MDFSTVARLVNVLENEIGLGDEAIEQLIERPIELENALAVVLNNYDIRAPMQVLIDEISARSVGNADLKMKARVLRAMYRYGCQNLYDISQLTREQVLSAPTVGEVTNRHLEEVLKEYGLTLAES